MVQIISRVPQQWATYRMSVLYFGRWRISSPNFAVGYDMGGASVREYNPGYILTTPSSELDGENDCFHYAVDGKLEFIPDWYEYGTPDEQGRVNISINGQSVMYGVAAILSDGVAERHDLQTQRVFLQGNPRGWTMYSVRLKDLTVSHRMIDSHLQHSEFTVQWKEEWTLIDYSYAIIPPPSDQGGQVTFTATETNVNWWNYRGSTGIPVPKMDFYIYSMELPDGPTSSFVDALHTRTSWECTLGDLSAKAAESIRMLDINSVAYAKDLLGVADLAKGLTSLASPTKGVKNLSKKVAKTYLAAHYGARLTIKDTQEIASAIDKYDRKHSVQTAGASEHIVIDCPGKPGTPVAVDLRLTARISSMSREDLNVVEAFKNFDRGLMELDLVPTAANVWDMVPFSFVVDWFLPIGDALERREIASYVKTLDVQAAFYSRKYTWAENLSWKVKGGTVTGPVKYKIYERKCQSTLALPPMRVDKPKGLSNHWVEGAAILISGI